jgi:hypothetical protein
MDFNTRPFDNLDVIIKEKLNELYKNIGILENFSDSDIVSQIKRAFEVLPKQYYNTGNQIFLDAFPDMSDDLKSEDGEELIGLLIRYQVQRERLIELLDDTMSKL